MMARKRKAPHDDYLEAEITPLPRIGRPPFDWREIDGVIDWYVASGVVARLPQGEFIKTVIVWCEARGRRAPRPKTLQTKIQAAQQRT